MSKKMSEILNEKSKFLEFVKFAKKKKNLAKKIDKTK